ncbi:28S ribosomal protein S31, mitochondrial [Nasonia vitripennis]|uniref:Small ribosomal subunit protein mS31 n=1 Tax=Nasonia vitripennis TaxID=7425 RepID=A0A7M7G4G1_NASVI|nr:28S ribosomal protein S31, mitochondrial [Nasonia vitripennis]
MLSFRVIPRNISHYLKQSTQQLHTSIKVLAAKDPQDSSSSSSSSDSSDSDSDKEDNKAKKPLSSQVKTENDDIPKISDTNERLNALLQKIAQASQKTKEAPKSVPEGNKTDNAFKTMKVAIKPRQERFKKTKKEPVIEKPYDEQLKSAAKEVAESLKGDSSTTELELLSQVLNLEKPALEKDDSSKEETATPAPVELTSLLSNMKIDQSPVGHILEDKRRARASQMFTARSKEPSLSESILYSKSMKKHQRFARPIGAELNVSHNDLGIFKNLSPDQAKDVPQLTTWEAMEAREIKLATLSSPQNVFQELIQWTEQGKIWRFPINNEQGMEEEEKVHFSEHVFMERHLKGWCPKRGPIRHFMELVCVGLSKNPYMTVEEKVGHITWYKDYFESKQELLSDLGVLDDKTKVTSQDQKQIQA